MGVVYFTSFHSKISTSPFHFNQLLPQPCFFFFFFFPPVCPQNQHRSFMPHAYQSGAPLPRVELLKRKEGSHWSSLAARGTGCSHGWQERGSPGAILGWCLEELFAPKRDRQLQHGLVWSELSHSWSSQDFQGCPSQRMEGEAWLNMGLIAVDCMQRERWWYVHLYGVYTQDCPLGFLYCQARCSQDTHCCLSVTCVCWCSFLNWVSWMVP